MGEPHDGGDEHVEHRDLVLDGVVEEAALQAEAGVVDQQVHREAPVRQACLDPGELLGVGEVGGEDLDVDPVLRADVGGHLLQAGGVTRDEHEVVAAGGELAGEFEADAGCGAGHE